MKYLIYCYFLLAECKTVCLAIPNFAQRGAARLF